MKFNASKSTMDWVCFFLLLTILLAKRITPPITLEPSSSLSFYNDPDLFLAAENNTNYLYQLINICKYNFISVLGISLSMMNDLLDSILLGKRIILYSKEMSMKQVYRFSILWFCRWIAISMLSSLSLLLIFLHLPSTLIIRSTPVLLSIAYINIPSILKRGISILFMIICIDIWLVCRMETSILTNIYGTFVLILILISQPLIQISTMYSFLFLCYE